MDPMYQNLLAILGRLQLLRSTPTRDLVRRREAYMCKNERRKEGGK